VKNTREIFAGSLRKPGIGVSPIVQQSQEFSIQNEDFPALPGFKGSKLIQANSLRAV
jgi:CCR4-NOT transcription complex subunit 2